MLRSSNSANFGGGQSSLSSLRPFYGFTLAEVLITLGIIGVVAAMTMPVLTAKYQKNITVTRLEKFYSSMNQAVRLSILDNGEVSNWVFPNNTNAQDTIDFINKYFAKYIKYTDIKTCPVSQIYGRGPWVCIYYADASVAAFNKNGEGFDIAFYVNSKYMGQELTKINSSRFIFPFCFHKYGKNENEKSVIDPYAQDWNGSRQQLLNGSRFSCGSSSTNGYCTKLIQYDGWQIKDDYPW